MPYRRLLQFQGLAFTAVVVVPQPGDGTAFGDQIEATIFNQTLLQYQAVAAPVFVPAAEVVTVDKWYEPLSEPTRRKPGPEYQQFHTTSVFVSEEGTWPFAPFSEPRRFRLSVPVQQDAAQVVLTDNQLTDIFESRWHQPWSEPVRTRAGVLSSLQQFLAFDPFPRPVELTTASWFEPFVDPVRQKVGLRADLQQATTIDPYALTQPEAVSEDKWHQPWSDPTRHRWPSQAALLATSTWSTFTPESIFADKWFASLSEPVRQKPGLGTQHQQFFTIDPYSLTKPESVTEDRWHQPWSEPVRQKSGLLAALQKITDVDPYPRPPEEFTVGSWLTPFGEPVRPKIGLRVDLQQFLAIDPYSLTQPEQVSEDRWHQPWSEPRRSRQFPTAAQQTSAQSILPVPVGIDWYVQFPNPTLRQWKPTTQVAFFANPATPAPTQVFLEWYENFVDPVRQKIGLRADLQQVASRNIDPIIPASPSWFEAYSEPIRLSLRGGLKAWLQQFFTTNTETPAGVTVTVTFSVTEINADVFTGAIFVTDGPSPIAQDPYALVSIIEVESALNTPTSIIES